MDDRIGSGEAPPVVAKQDSVNGDSEELDRRPSEPPEHKRCARPDGSAMPGSGPPREAVLRGDAAGDRAHSASEASRGRGRDEQLLLPRAAVPMASACPHICGKSPDRALRDQYLSTSLVPQLAEGVARAREAAALTDDMGDCESGRTTTAAGLSWEGFTTCGIRVSGITRKSGRDGS